MCFLIFVFPSFNCLTNPVKLSLVYWLCSCTPASLYGGSASRNTGNESSETSDLVLGLGIKDWILFLCVGFRVWIGIFSCKYGSGGGVMEHPMLKAGVLNALER